MSETLRPHHAERMAAENLRALARGAGGFRWAEVPRPQKDDRIAAAQAAWAVSPGPAIIEAVRAMLGEPTPERIQAVRDVIEGAVE